MKRAVRIDVSVKERREGAEIFRRQALLPARLTQDPLDHQRVDIDQGTLQEMQRQHRQLLVFPLIGGKFSSFAKENKIVGAVPVLDDVQPFMDFPPQRWQPEILT